MRAPRCVANIARCPISARIVICAALLIVALAMPGSLSWSQPFEAITLDTATRRLTAAIEENLGPSNRVEIGAIRLDRDAQGRPTLRADDIAVHDPAGGLVARLTALTAEQAADGTLKVSLRGEVHDGRAVVKSLSGLSSDQMAQASDLDLDVTLDAFGGFNGESMRSFQLKLSRRAHRIAGLDLTARLGSDVPVNAELRRTTGGRDVIHLETRDAGALLRFADLYRHISGGWMWMTMAPPSADPAPLEGTLNLRDFVIHDEPALQRLGTPASSPGATANGPNGAASGIEFSHLGIDFTRRPERVILRDGIVRGSSLAATTDGTIDYAGNDMRLRGTIVPLSGVNNMPGQIPVIGLLLGGNNQGLTVTFEATGPTFAPLLRINPISPVAPDLLRKVLQAR
jgi:hypothetical protein